MKRLFLAVALIAVGCKEQPRGAVIPMSAKTTGTIPAKHTATIVDGPKYLASKKTSKQLEAELAQYHANSGERPGMAGQPHDDGNGIAVDPNTIPAKADRYRNNPDVYIRPLAPSGPITDQIMVMMPYGPCSTVSQIGQRFVWAGDHLSTSVPPEITSQETLADIAYAKYPDTPFEISYTTGQEAIAAAVTDCEATYRQVKAEVKAKVKADWEATRAMSPGLR
jgi:hypothetical protein